MAAFIILVCRIAFFLFSLSFETNLKVFILNQQCLSDMNLILDMQKFPLRMKDNDLLVTELYKDPTLDHITAISVYLTPKTTSK